MSFGGVQSVAMLVLSARQLLDEAIAAAPDPLPGLDGGDDATCDNGACFT